jgi:hypothetical protein
MRAHLFVNMKSYQILLVLAQITQTVARELKFNGRTINATSVGFIIELENSVATNRRYVEPDV